MMISAEKTVDGPWTTLIKQKGPRNYMENLPSIHLFSTPPFHRTDQRGTEKPLFFHIFNTAYYYY